MAVAYPQKLVRHLSLLLACFFVFIGQAGAREGYGNENAQEYGDAVYVYSPWVDVFTNYNHAGIFVGMNSSDSERVIEARLSACDPDNSFQDSFTIKGDDYYGAYTLSNITLTFSYRKAIVKTARDLVADGDIGYPSFPMLGHDALEYFGDYFSGYVSDIDTIRCDGVVEYCYEKNEKKIWWDTSHSSQWNIATDDGVEYHNNMPGSSVDPDFELSPWAQRGAPQVTGPSFNDPNPNNTKMTRSAVIDFPTYQVSSWQSGSHMVVRIKATDSKSGIHKISWRLPGESSGWHYARKSQHPDYDSSSVDINVYSEGTLYYWAQDNGGNQPQYAESLYVNFNELPYTPYNESPNDGATGVLRTANLDWSCTDPDGDTIYYTVWLSKGNNIFSDSERIKIDATGSNADPGTMDYDAHYYWKVQADDHNGGVTTVDHWDFYTESTPNQPPNPPYNESPNDGATGVSCTANLDWSCTDPDGDTIYYTVWLSKGNTIFSDSERIKINAPGSNADPGTMDADAHYYWKVQADDHNGGVTTVDHWDFYTVPPSGPPNPPYNESPNDGATGVSCTANLDWSCTDPDGDTIYYTVWLSKGDDTFSDPERIKIDAPGSDADPGTMDADAHYYWKVQADDHNGGVTTVDHWDFLTESCTYNISPTSKSFTSSGGTGTVSVTTESDCDWTSISNDDWITITSDSVGSGDGSVNYSVSSYEGTSPRTGTMTIAGKTFTVTQSGPCIYSISPTSQSFSSSGGSGTVSVTTTESDCDWTATSNYDWITITSDSSGIGNGTVSYWVSNSSTSFRAGTMTIAGETFTVTQGDLVSPVYRFWSDTQQAHFYTIDEGEKEHVIATYPDNVWRYEGIAFYTFAEGNQPADAAAVHRFWSDTQQAHFYTIDEGEKEYVIATYPENVWRYEGIAFYTYP